MKPRMAMLDFSKFETHTGPGYKGVAMHVHTIPADTILDVKEARRFSPEGQGAHPSLLSPAPFTRLVFEKPDGSCIAVADEPRMNACWSYLKELDYEV